MAVLIIAIANRLTRGASRFYRDAWTLGVVEWRVMMCLRADVAQAVGEIAERADLDTAAVSRSLKGLKARGYIETRPAARRVNHIRLTREGQAAARALRASGLRREKRLMSAFSAVEAVGLRAMLYRLCAQVDVMNDPDGTAAAGRSARPSS